MIKTIEVYGEMHRYIPVIASNEGFTKIDEQVIKDIYDRIEECREYYNTLIQWD